MKEYKKIPKIYQGSKKLNEELASLLLFGKFKDKESLHYHIFSKMAKNTFILDNIEPIRHFLSWYYELKNNTHSWRTNIFNICVVLDYNNVSRYKKRKIEKTANSYNNIFEANKYMYKCLLPYVLNYVKHGLYKDKNKYKRLP